MGVSRRAWIEKPLASRGCPPSAEGQSGSIIREQGGLGIPDLGAVSEGQVG